MALARSAHAHGTHACSGTARKPSWLLLLVRGGRIHVPPRHGKRGRRWNGGTPPAAASSTVRRPTREDSSVVPSARCPRVESDRPARLLLSTASAEHVGRTHKRSTRSWCAAGHQMVHRGAHPATPDPDPSRPSNRIRSRIQSTRSSGPLQRSRDLRPGTSNIGAAKRSRSGQRLPMNSGGCESGPRVHGVCPAGPT